MREADIQINRVDWIAVSIYFALVIIAGSTSTPLSMIAKSKKKHF